MPRARTSAGWTAWSTISTPRSGPPSGGLGLFVCGDDTAPLQRDCVQPPSRGRRDTLDNIVPACRSGNASKCNHEGTAWMRRRRLDERGFLVRHIEVRDVLVGRFSP